MKRFVVYLMLILAIPATVMAQPRSNGPKGKTERHEPRHHEPRHHESRHHESRHHEARTHRNHHPHATAPMMNSRDYEDALRVICAENFDDKRLSTAKRIVAANPMSTRQIAGICREFTFEANRLEFAKFAHRYCVDPSRYYLVDEVFTFESSRKELHDFIRIYE